MIRPQAFTPGGFGGFMSDEDGEDVVEETAPKPKRNRRKRYRFTGGGIRIIDGKRIKAGDVVLLNKSQVTREYEDVA